MNHSLGQPTPNSIEDLTGRTFNRWKCLGYAEKRGTLHFWHFRCKCGTEAIKHSGHIVNGTSTSCGCAHSENLSKRNKTHGKSRTEEYVIWKAIWQRCTNPKHIQYCDYGARGITVCKRWRGRNGFRNFLADMGPRPKGYTIERRENKKGYEPSNCHWATPTAQNRNKRNNLLITAFGKTQCLAAWAEECGLTQGCLYYRIVTGKWDSERALTVPSHGTPSLWQKNVLR